MNLSKATDEQLLAELFKRNKQAPAPFAVSYSGPHTQIIVPVGKDHSIAINACDEALAQLPKDA